MTWALVIILYGSIQVYSLDTQQSCNALKSKLWTEYKQYNKNKTDFYKDKYYRCVPLFKGQVK